MGTIHKFHINNLTTYDFELLTICHMQFDVDYEIESGRFREEGLEVYTIDTSGSKPKVVWRSQVALNTDDS